MLVLFFSYDANMFACGKQKRNMNNTSPKEKMFSEIVFGRKIYITSPIKNIVFWSKKDIILRRKKMFSETVKKRYDTSPEKKFFDVLLLPFAKQIVCFHLNVFSVVYCVYCCIVS